MKIVKSLEGSVLLLKAISDTFWNQAKKLKERFISLILGALEASLLQSAWTEKGVIRAGENF